MYLLSGTEIELQPNSPAAASAVTSLGAGSRSPAGIEPYVAFVRDAVFLKFNTR